ncbi:MAG: cyclic nucleotide-binding domain-containing protein, partial [Kovacikia sp.]
MTQPSPVQTVSREQLSHLLGQSLSEQEFSQCLKQMQFLEPTAGKRFWQSFDHGAIGLYLILEGKVRLLDLDDNLLTTLDAGDSFGETSLFPEGAFQAYAARASIHLKLCYLPAKLLQPLMQKYPTIRQQLHQQAVRHNWLLLANGVEEQKQEQQKQVRSGAETQGWGNRENFRSTLSHSPVPDLTRDTPASPRHKISRAYFPSPAVQVGHWWQRISHRYAFYAQQSASDCGAACLVMVSRYWGKNFSLN